MNIKEIIIDRYKSKSKSLIVVNIKVLYQKQNAHLVEVLLYSKPTKTTNTVFTVLLYIPQINMYFIRSFIS